MTGRLETTYLRMNSSQAENSTYKKLAVQWLNEALCYIQSSYLIDIEVPRNPPPVKTSTVNLVHQLI